MYDIERMKKEIPIEDVCNMLGIPLGKKSGANIFGSIRNERTDSFSINPGKNIWRDWGTNEGGNVIDLVMKVENIDMGRAVQMLADRFNYQNETKTSATNTYLPSKKQFKEIGVIADRTLSNFDLNLEKQSLEKLEELEAQYSISINELSSKNPKLYHRIIDKKALPIISMERNLLIDTLKTYKNEPTPFGRAFIKSSIKDLEESLNNKIDIYNKARLDGITKDNLKLHIADRLPEENIDLTATTLYKFNHETTQVIKDLLPYELSIGIGNEYYSTNLMIDKTNGKALGLEINDKYTSDDYYKLLSGDKNEFLDTFYIEPLWNEFSEALVRNKDSFEECTLGEDFHIWNTGTKVSDIINWFEKNYTKSLVLLEEATPLEFTDINTSIKNISNIVERQDKLSNELEELELKISDLDNKIGTYSNDLSSNKGKYHIYIDDNINNTEMFFAVSNTKKEAVEIKKDTYLKTNRNTTIRNLKNEIPKLQEEVANLRTTYDIKMEEYLEILNQTNPFSDETSNDPYRYYLTQRPPSIGTHPKGNINTVSFDSKQNFEGVECWGYVEYEQQLSEKEIYDFELTEKKSYIYEIKGDKVNLEKENLSDIEYFKTNKNLTLEDGSRIRKGTSLMVEGGSDEAYEVRFEVNPKNKYSNDTNEYIFTKSEILNFAEPELELVNSKISEKEIDELYSKALIQEHIEKEIGDIMSEIRETPLIDMKVDKDVDVSEILENLKNGVGNIFNNENFIEYLNFQSQFHKYSPNNSLLIAIQNPQATNVASFNKWKSLGRMVKKGEKGIMILAPNVTKNDFKDIMARLDKYGKTNVSKYTFTKNNNSYSISSFGKNIKTGLTQNELESFVKINKLSQTSIKGFRKTYVFDISQTSGQPIPEFKLKLNDTNLLDKNGFYKNPLFKVQWSEGSIFEDGQTLTFKQVNEIYNRKNNEVKELRKNYEEKGEYYPYFKQKFDIILKPNEPIYGVKRNLRLDIGDGEYNTLLEALKGEMKGYPQIFETLEETLNSNENDMETILALKNQLEKTCDNKGIKLEYIGDTGTANGYFEPAINKISVNNEMSFSQTTKTLLHEYVHSQLHVNEIQSKDQLTDRQTAEIEAEATTYVVAKNFGFDTSEYSFDYVSTWARGKEVKELEQTLKTIKEASEKIINELKAPLELEIYNTKENIEEILRNENIKPNDKIVNNMLDINKETGKINTVSDLVNAEKFKSYTNPELSSKIKETNKEIVTNTVKVEVKTMNVAMER